jgi:hypothetical protein
VALTAGALIVGAGEWSELCDIAASTWGGPYPERAAATAVVPTARVAAVVRPSVAELHESAAPAVPIATIALAD